MVVCVGQEFAGFLGGSIGRDWIVYVFRFREEGVLGYSIHRAGGGEDKVLQFKQKQEQLVMDMTHDVHNKH